MPFQGFEGPAGTGKTFQLIGAAGAHCAAHALTTHHRILALTFMNGSRRRLDERLSASGPFKDRYVCMTIDSFAAEIIRRWRTLASVMGIEAENFDQICDAAGQLLEHPSVARWVAATYPAVLVDEAQELGPPRLRVIRALAAHVALFVAADEFQCLDERIDTQPFMEWFRTGRVTSLTQVRRTSLQGLLAAALALREGRAVPAKGPGISITYQHPNQMPFSIGHALHAARRAGGTTAMILAPGAGPWAERILPKLRQGMKTAKQTVLPLVIERETRTDDEIEQVRACLGRHETIPTGQAIACLQNVADGPPWLSLVIAALKHQLRACATEEWSSVAIGKLIERKANLHRAYGYQRQTAVPVITIQSAKNRQFRNVVVLWGAAVQGDADRKARLLYNAITRTEARCTVFVQQEGMLLLPPFQLATPTDD